jgi:hypothetical protein
MKAPDTRYASRFTIYAQPVTNHQFCVPISRIFLLFLLLVVWGCDSVRTVKHLPEAADRFEVGGVYDNYTPAKIEIMPLTEFASVGDDEQTSKINVYVSLLDSFSSQIKWPGVFRFELYERVFRSADPKGRRIAIWSDVDLTEAARNDEYWQDFLRAYQFGLDFVATERGDYILQITYLSVDGRRLYAEFDIRRTE